MRQTQQILPEGLPYILNQPENPAGWVIFAHGSGSSRMSPRNQQVARALNDAGLATMLFDLLTEEEGKDRARVFDIPLLAERLKAATRWLELHHLNGAEPIGYFGASTGAAAALIAAADLGERVSAVVSRGGRADLAQSRLQDVSCPTLLIVGEADDLVLELNRRALGRLARGELMIVPRATHLFEEPGALVHVQEAAGWFFLRSFAGRFRERTAA